MKAVRDTNGTWVISLEKGDMVRESIEGLAKEHDIRAAKISGIGAVERPILGSYDLPEKSYHRRTLPGIWELLTFAGNISLHEGVPFLHAHVTVSGHDLEVLGGHLFDARIAVVGEFFVEPLTVELPREQCDEIGLARWQPGG